MISDAYRTSPAVVQIRDAISVDTFSRRTIEILRFPCRAFLSQYQYLGQERLVEVVARLGTAMLLAAETQPPTTP